jgi:hypothetical protein
MTRQADCKRRVRTRMAGVPVVGKMTVGQVIAERTGLRVFHNHVLIELALRYFDFGTPGFRRIKRCGPSANRWEIAASDLPGLIFTSTCRRTRSRLTTLRGRAAAAAAVSCASNSKPPWQNIEGPSRLAEKPSKRDVRQPMLRLLKNDECYQLNSGKVRGSNPLSSTDVRIYVRTVKTKSRT